MHLKELLPKTLSDPWEDRANEVLSHFSYEYPDEIDMDEICWRYGIKIRPLDPDFFPGVITEKMKSFGAPLPKNRRGIIYLKPKLDPIERKILLAEEFCHIYAHNLCELDMDKPLFQKTENQAKRMAAYILMPHYFLEQVYVAAEDQAVMISEIADYFLVTEEFAQYRLELIFKRKIDGFATLKGKLGTIQWFE
ncbi:hypothetical protein BSNK01_12600 [Bacillaceae bacterium]